MHRNIKSLDRQLKEMERYLQQIDVQKPAVSNAPVGWHLAHNLKVINTVIPALKYSDPKDFTKEFSLQKIIVFMTGLIPRGKAKSPKAVLPPENLKTEELIKELHLARKSLSQFYGLDKNAFFIHPFFKKLNRDQTARFLVIHTRHHLKIVSDILK